MSNSSPYHAFAARWLPWAVGIWFAISLLKFGNPVILNDLVSKPQSSAEWIISAWPLGYAALFILPVLLLAIPLSFNSPLKNKWFVWLPLAWWIWQKLAASYSVAPNLTGPTVLHFMVVVLAFQIGCFALAGKTDLRGLWIPLLIGFLLVLWSGFEQRHGGLEAMRRFVYEQPNYSEMPLEYRQKLASNRIFSTLVYPNALAGAILLLFPPLALKLAQLSATWPRVAQGVIRGLFAYASVACLAWTGSKAGWLIALIMVVVWLVHARGFARYRYWIAGLVVIVGLSAFFIRYQGYFKRGATSVSARFTYWDAAWQTALKNPVFGSGPGTFQVAYKAIKPPDAEMARLTHNDYLEQASDSGFVGMVLFTGFIWGFLALLYRKRKSIQHFAVFLGLLGWALQGFVEFGLYIPAIAWPAFLLLGWGVGESAESETEVPKPLVSAS